MNAVVASRMNPRRRRVMAGLAATGVLAPYVDVLATTRSTVSRRPVKTSDGVRLSVIEAGLAARGRTSLVFLPGWGMPASVWHETLAEFGPRYHCLAIDPRGQGESEVPDSGYTVDRRAADLADVIAPLDRVILVGWSLGVLESLHYVRAFGHAKLAALVLVDNSVGEPPAPTPTDFLKRLRADRAATVDRFVRGMFATPQPDARIDEIRRSVLKMRLEHSIALLSYPLPREHWRDIARGFPKPLAYLVTPRLAAQAESLKAARPGTVTEIFEGAGHAVFVDQSDRFRAVLGEFVRAAT